MTIEEIVTREVRVLDEPMDCSTECHDQDAPWHGINCPANVTNRLRAMGHAIAKAVVEECAQTVQGLVMSSMIPDRIRALAAQPGGEKGR